MTLFPRELFHCETPEAVENQAFLAKGFSLLLCRARDSYHPVWQPEVPAS